MALSLKPSLSTLMLVAGSVLVINAFSASPALAGCNPKCPSGETCRYEAAGGKFYCEVSKSARKGVMGGKLKQMQVEGSGLRSDRGDSPLK